MGNWKIENPVNANSGLKVDLCMNFSSLLLLSHGPLVQSDIIQNQPRSQGVDSKSKQKAKLYPGTQKTSLQSYKTQSKFSLSVQ